MRTSRRVSELPLSLTLALDARAKELVAAGRDIVNMSVGEPDFPAPPVVQRAAVAKVQSGDVRYTQAAGTPALRAAIARHLTATRGASYGPEEVAVCHSAKHALSGALFSLIDPGDEVLLSLPYWVSYADLVRLAGGHPVLVPASAGCRPNLAGLRAALTPRTRGLLLNSPCNPSGVVWTEAELRAATELARERDLWILSDEIYRRLTYAPARFASPVALSADARARTVIVDGASKSFAMTGYRIGYAAGPSELIAAIGRFHSQMAGSPNAISQAAFQAGLEGEPPEVGAMAAEFERRRDRLLAGLAELGLPTPRPDGAFYAFPDVSRYLDERGTVGWCSDLLEDQGLAIVPGTAFGMEGHVRLSYALSMERLAEALKRLGAFLRASARR